MGFSITNTGKAKDVLNESKIGQNIIKGDAENIKTEPKKIIKEIIDTGECKLIRSLDKGGRYLKDSVLTRSTAHKIYDFSSIQSESGLNVQKLYKDILNNIPQDIFPKQKGTEIVLNKKVKKEIKELEKKLNKALSNIQKTINQNEEMKDFIKKQLSDEKITTDTLNKLDGLFVNNITFVEKLNQKKGENLGKQKVKLGLKALNLGTILGPAFALIGGGFGSLVAVMSGWFSVGWAISLVGPIFGAASFGVGLVVPAVIAAGFFIGALVVYCNKEDFGTILLKKLAIKINDEFRTAIKCVNKAAYLVSKNAQATNSEEQDIQPTEKQDEILKKFIATQQKLWRPYTTAEGRQYTKTEDSSESGTHKTRGITVKNEKTSTIGKMKLGIAKTWVAIKI